jgi:ankyrin repeat protein
MAKGDKDRPLLARLLQSALLGDISTLESTVDEYVTEHENISPSQVLLQSKDGKKRTVLHFACQSQHKDTDIVEFIVNHPKWFPNNEQSEKNETLEKVLKQKDSNGLTPLMLAAQHRNKILAERRTLILLSKSAGLGRARSTSGATALHYAAAATARPGTIRALHQSTKVAINTFSNNGGTPLHFFCATLAATTEETQEKHFFDTLETLLECGADVNAHKISTMTTAATRTFEVPPPILVAIAAKNDGCCQRLLQYDNVDIDIITTQNNNNLLHSMVESDMKDSLRTLIEKIKLKDSKTLDPLLSVKNTNGLIPLDIAANKGYVKCVQLLLDATKSDDSSTAICESDAHTYIDEYKKQQEQQQQQQSESKEDIQNDSSVITNHKDNTEKAAVEIAAAIMSSSDVSPMNLQRAIELKARGNKYFMKKKWKEANDLYTNAISFNPKEATFYSNRSACLLNLERYPEALNDAVVATTFHPEWSKAWYRLSMARLSLNRYEDAAMAAWKGLQLDPQNKELKSLLQKSVQMGREYNRKK